MRCDVTVRIETVLFLRSTPQIVEIGIEVGQVVIVGHVVDEPANFCESHTLMKSHLSLRSADVKGSVPGTTIRAIEPATFGSCMGVGRVNNTCVWYLGNKLLGADARKQLVLCQQPVVRGIVKIENVSQVISVIRNEGEYTVFSWAVLRLDKTMGVVAPNTRKR
nr:hypothetical protein [Acidicapsa acidisoli]